jgi:hypothetical protein
MISKHRKQRECGFVGLLLLLVVVVAGIGGAGWYVYYQRYHHAPPIAKLAANCQQPELNLSIGPSSGTAGTIYVDAVFTNQSLRTCTLDGYPSVVLVDAHNATLGAPAMHSTAFPASTVTLHPGESAHAAMGFPEPGNFAPSICSAASTNLRATPPGTIASLETPLTRQYCPGFSVTTIQPGI